MTSFMNCLRTILTACFQISWARIVFMSALMASCLILFHWILPTKLLEYLTGMILTSIFFYLQSDLLDTCEYHLEEHFNEKMSQYSDEKFSLFHLNIRSLNKNFDNLSNHLSLLNTEFSVISLSLRHGLRMMMMIMTLMMIREESSSL